MSNAEAIMWAVEKDPALRSDFCNFMILDRRPTDERLHQTMQRALDAIPRLGQRVIGAPLRIAPPEFADDPNLDLDAHVRIVAVPAPGDDRALLDLCGALAEQPLDRARPLWEFTVIDGLPDGRAAMLQKVHHTITDGVGGLKLSLAMVDFERDPEWKAPDDAPATAAVHTTPLSAARDAVVDAGRRGIDAVRRTIETTGHVVVHPSEIPGRASDAARLVSSLQRQALVTDAARSDVIDGRSLRRRFEICALPFEPLRTVAGTLGGSLNDAFVTGLASALGRYHERAHSDVDELRLAMPVSTRQRGDTKTNAFVPARVLVPIQPAHDLRTLFGDVHERLQSAKQETALHAAEGLAGVVAGLPTSLLVTMTRSQTRTIDFGASNLRGSPVPLYVAGARIVASYPMGPRTGCALTVTMLSYCDELHLGLNIDPAAIVDPRAFMRDVRDAFAELASLA
ncbi:MAG TPA: wax ester/triacylglycerol synthase domain-containing protein [Acidimicrobiia bacterium]|nr:wax ester/triacylglycerol synthase domain-containing protein [Acidimicrobiia bacterium]